MRLFTRTASDKVSGLSEGELLGRIGEWTRACRGEAPEGPGDDCAVFSPKACGAGESRQLATVDGVVYGRHFDAEAPAEAVGRKLVNRNLSDIAAMGGVPHHALMTLML